MNTDSYFSIGQSHLVCEDYAFTGIPDGAKHPVAIISDGCSTGRHTDVGSRLLVHSLLLKSPLVLSDAVQHSGKIIENLSLPVDSLFGTLLTLEVAKGKQIKAQVQGDGGVIARRRDTGDLEIHWLNYYANAPEYLAYFLNPSSYESFLKKYGNKKAVEITVLSPDNEIISSYAKYVDEIIYEEYFSFEEYDLVAITSDGLDAFTGFDYLEAIHKVMAFKNYKGEFVKRRVRRFLKEILAEGEMKYNDDVSLAAIYIP